MKNENTTDAICVCGHEFDEHFDIRFNWCKQNDCRCKSFTPATTDEVIKDLTVYAVQFSNYQPPEIDSLWTSKSDAENHCETLEGSWEVTSMTVYGALSLASDPATSTVKQKLQAEIRELKLERDSLQRKVDAAKDANRYALATFRALDQYTFQDSDHGLLISEAVKKLEDDPLKEMEGLPS